MSDKHVEPTIREVRQLQLMQQAAIYEPGLGSVPELRPGPTGEALMRAAVAQMERKPESLDMTKWIRTGTACGTTLCLGGHALAAYGLSERDIVALQHYHMAGLVATSLLGLSSQQAQALFYVYGDELTVVTLKERITKITGITFDPPVASEPEVGADVPDDASSITEELVPA